MPGTTWAQGPAVYRISVAGRLDQQWSSWFEDLALTHDGRTTTLTGVVADQAALHGLLERVRDVGVPLLSVARVDAAADDRKTDS
jgi:hypothetical protein